ncbi:MAG: sporulation protein [Burkholderiales bacterium PBB6]|nr:MAG: sporulation protein [Burkholderiales bacterium PBB6]
MGLLSKFKFGNADKRSNAAADAADVVRDARLKARRRLIGAAVLLGAGIIGFPLLFETQPRPIPVDIPIEIPSRDGVSPLVPPSMRQNPNAPDRVASPPPIEPSASEAAEMAARGERAEREVIEPVVKPSQAQLASAPAARAAEKKPEAKPVEKKPEPKPEPKPVEKKPEPKPAEKKPEPKPAEKKPEPKPDAAADSGRFVVQIGAFSEVTSAREARLKVEAMGLKTYTQVIESASGRRIRVRVGPYPTKAEADKAASRIKSGGLPAAVLVL